MITEDYCSYDIAKLLKEKGFDEPVQYFYKFDSKELYRGTIFTNTQIGDKFYNAPTHQMAMKWLREVHNLCIAPYAAAYRYGFTIDKADTGSNLGNEMKFYPEDEFETYENAVEAALKYCLENLI